ncbi:MAG: hypothetical protein Q9210_003531 [Variospora velana]
MVLPSATSLTGGATDGAAEMSSGAVHDIASPSLTSSSIHSDATASVNQTLSKPFDHEEEFWAGAGIDTVPRAEALPGRTFYDFDGKTIKGPINKTFRGDCLGPEPFVNSANSLPDEQNFRLKLRCISTKVETAKRAKAAGMRLMEYAINQGRNISMDMERYTYQQMVEEAVPDRADKTGRITPVRDRTQFHPIFSPWTQQKIHQGIPQAASNGGGIRDLLPVLRVRQQQRHTRMMWSLAKSFPSFLGMLWWDLWYCNNHWEDGEVTSYHLSFGPGFTAALPQVLIVSVGAIPMGNGNYLGGKGGDGCG